MTEIEKMKRYIERTKLTKGSSYQMNFEEALNLARAAADTPVNIIYLAFEYGRAKGYRAAKAERRAAV